MAAGLGGCWCADNSDAGPFARVGEAIVFLMQWESCVFPGLEMACLTVFLFLKFLWPFSCTMHPPKSTPTKTTLCSNQIRQTGYSLTVTTSLGQAISTRRLNVAHCTLLTTCMVLHMQATYSTSNSKSGSATEAQSRQPLSVIPEVPMFIWRILPVQDYWWQLARDGPLLALVQTRAISASTSVQILIAQGSQEIEL